MGSKCEMFVKILFFTCTSQAYKIWQLTDVHLDYKYSATGDVNNWCHVRKEPDG